MLIRLGMDDMLVVLRDTSSLILWSSATFLAPIIISLFYMEPFLTMASYAAVAVFAFFLGFVGKMLFRTETETTRKHSFLTVAIVWLVYTGLAALPFVLVHNMGLLDAFFESMSAITTTGLTMMAPTLDSAAKSLIFWRSVISWTGGIGIVVLALSGVLTTYTKSSKLIVAEGREENIRPNIKNTMREIWSIYALMTVLGVLLLYASGMNLFDSINYSMSAISTTGMDTEPGLLTDLHNYWIDFSLIIIMILGATSFSVHYLLIKKRDLNTLFLDMEFRALVIISALATITIMPKLILFYGSNLVGMEYAFFHVVSSFTCGGFALTSPHLVSQWSDFVKIILVLLMFVGGSSGSTAGGIKISRFLLFVKSVFWKIKASVLPADTYFQRKFEGRDVMNSELREVSQFIILYVIFILAGVLILTGLGNDLGNAVFEVVSAQSNVGVSAGITSPDMPAVAKAMLILNMWIGRLEIVPILSAIGFALSVRRR